MSASSTARAFDPSSSPSVAGLVSIAGRAGHAFSPHKMVHGFACHARGIDIQTRTSTEVRARLRAKPEHVIEVRAVDGHLTVECSCVARALDVATCLHEWAVLLEIDRTGGLEELRRAPGTLVVTPGPSKEADPPAKMKPKTKAKAKAKPKAKEKGQAKAKAQRKKRSS
jgi:hypothetical protein